MPKIRNDEKEVLTALSKTELVKIVVKLAAKKENYDFLLINYFDKQFGEKDLFEECKADIDRLCRKSYKGFSEQLQHANMLSACIKRINNFKMVSKNKNLEADLLLYVLDLPFAGTYNLFGTCFTQYDSNVGRILKRLITIVTRDLHPDCINDYKEPINEYLAILHSTSNHLDSIYDLPNKID